MEGRGKRGRVKGRGEDKGEKWWKEGRIEKGRDNREEKWKKESKEEDFIEEDRKMKNGGSREKKKN